MNEVISFFWANTKLVTGLAATVLFVCFLLFAVKHLRRRKRRKLDITKYSAKWQQIQGMLKDRKLWPLAIIDADKLLDDALKARRYKGKTAGERLVDAQHDIQNNDKVWFAHKLRNKLVHEQDVPLKKSAVVNALYGIRETLKDIGALERKQDGDK